MERSFFATLPISRFARPYHLMPAADHPAQLQGLAKSPPKLVLLPSATSW